MSTAFDLARLAIDAAKPVILNEAIGARFRMLDLEALAQADRYLIWSNEHRAWWRPNHASYTVHAEQAGRYTHEEALRICAGARDGWRPGEPPPEIPVAEADVLHCERRYVERGGKL